MPALSSLSTNHESVGFSTPSRGIVYRSSNVPAELPPDRFNRDSAYIRSRSTRSRQRRVNGYGERSFTFPFSLTIRKCLTGISFSHPAWEGGWNPVYPHPRTTYTKTTPSHPSTQNPKSFPNSNPGGGAKNKFCKFQIFYYIRPKFIY